MNTTRILPSDDSDSNIMHPEFSRRDFLRWVAISAGGVVATQLVGCGGGSSSTAASDTLSEPPTLRSSNGVLSMDLIADYSSQPIELGTAANSNAYPSPKTIVNTTLRRYTGAFPAPTLRVKAGDTIKIRLINHLPPSPSNSSSLGF